MKKYWRSRQSMIARMHTIRKLPKELKTTIFLRPEEHVLLISNDGVQLFPDNPINLKSKEIRKNATGVMFFSTNIFPIINQISYRIAGDSEEKIAELNYDIAVSKSSSYLLREGLISNYKNMNEIDSLSLAEVIQSKLMLQKSDFFERLSIEELRDATNKERIERKISSELKTILAAFGIDLITLPSLTWLETANEKLEAFKHARVTEIQAYEELMQIEQISNMSMIQMEAMEIAQNKLKRSRRDLVKKERAFQQSQFEAKHQMRLQSLESDKEKFRLQKEHELGVLRKKMENELSEIDLQKIINERFAEDEKRIILEEKKAKSEFKLRMDELDLFYHEEEMKKDLIASRAANIESERIVKDFDREEQIKQAETNSRLEDIEEQTKMNKLKQLIQIKAMKEQLKSNEKEVLSPCGTLKLKEGKWVPIDESEDQSKTQGNSQNISGNVIGGDLHINQSKSKANNSKQNISGNIISGNVKIEDADD